MQLYIHSYGSYIHTKNGLFEIKIEGEKKRFSPLKISSIVISNFSTLSSNTVRLALKHNIDIIFLDEFGDPFGRIWFPKLGSTTYIRRKLLEIYTNDEGLIIVKKWVIKKITNQIEFLKLLISKRKKTTENYSIGIKKLELLIEKISKLKGKISSNSNSLMGYEGNAAKHYFKILSELIPIKYKFFGRSSRPAKDIFNTFLNYGYGILYSKVEKALVIAGLDPYIGLFHTDNYNKKSLVFDFIEPYRVMVEKVVFYLFSRRLVKDRYYEKILDGFILNKEGKKLLVEKLMKSFSEKIRYNNKNIKSINRILVDAHSFANYLIDKKRSF